MQAQAVFGLTGVKNRLKISFMKKQLLIKRTVQQPLVELLKITSVTLLLFVLIDVCFGAWVMSLVRPTDTFRVRHPIYHHTLKPNFDGIGY